MAEGDDSVAHLERDLKRFLGITKNANTPKSSQSVHKNPDTVHQGILNQHAGVDGSEANTQVSQGKNQESTPKGRKNPRVRNRKRSEALLSSTNIDDAGKVRENASSSTGNDGGQEKKNSSKQQNLLNQPITTTGFIRDRRWHLDALG